MSTGSGDIVLVHGTTQSAAGFEPLVAALAARGRRACTVDIPSAGANSAAEYAELLAAQLPADLDSPVVAAHSAAGLVLPATAKRLAARHQVWLAAAVADFAGGRSLLDELRQDPTAMFHAEWLGVDPTSDPVLATYFLFHDADLATLRAALSTVAGCDLSTVYAEAPTIDPARLPSTYLLPTADRTLTKEWMARAAAERLGTAPIEVSGGHNFYFADPEGTAERLCAL
ncbi:alpha/beta hydrolase family protein [Tamaricihabitans halophyticus]|uniref:Alpha/beta hydrolase family protein n=1 Tax=Tamaricihabitans halophyticus TaxID=1262583 RepID=A0A4R2QVX4_9PSEU|nr:alpha/beta hydrolase [Tamaricihabitans halophyticus]TCP54240.1 alpha/beta hydrolase family protein [Tamaricihabitans halophyticus]